MNVCYVQAVKLSEIHSALKKEDRLQHEQNPMHE